jgi:hypothetical protein
MKQSFRQVAKNHACFALLAASLSLTSCEETIDLDLDQVREHMVIEGIVSDKPLVSGVRLSFSKSIYTTSAAKSTDGAVVTLSDDSGNNEVLQEVQPGNYAPTRMTGSVGREYRLKVTFEGTDYMSISRMPEPMFLDSVKTSVSGNDPRFSRRVELMYYVTNKPGVEEFCIIKAYGQNDGQQYYWTLFGDKNSDGKQVALDGPSFYTSGTSVRVEIISIDKAVYEYLRALEEIVGHDSFVVPDLLKMNAYNPRSNITNGALGYFSAQSQRDHVVPLR